MITKRQPKPLSIVLFTGFCAASFSLTGCDPAPGSQADQAAIKASHVDTSITPQQRIDKINNDPKLTPEQKATFIEHIKAKNNIK